MTAVNPFIYSDAAKKTFYFVSDLPHLGFIHLSKLSTEELKGLAQFFNLMATKHSTNLLYTKVLGISCLALVVIGTIATSISVGNDDFNAFSAICLSVTIGGLLGTIYFIGKNFYESCWAGHHTQWKNYTLEMIDLKLNPIEISN
jgi:hypothetical protein